MDPDHPHRHGAARYVVSQDLSMLLERWMRVRFGRVVDLDYGAIRAELTDILTFNGHVFESVGDAELRDGIAALLRNDPRPVISVDPVYWPTGLMLQLTRCVGHDLQKIEGVHPRFGYPQCEEQYRQIACSLRAGTDDSSRVAVTLVDDVVYSGSVVRAIAKGFSRYGVDLRRVVCGIAVAPPEGSDPVTICAEIGAELAYVRCYGIAGAPPAVDEVCERDFFAFCPMTGRTLFGAPQDTGVPYIAPFGLPVDWATFDQAQEPRISQRLIRLNIRTLEMIEHGLGQHVTFSHLDRVPLGVRHPKVASESVREHLLAHLD